MIGGFKEGDRVVVVKNGGQYDGRKATVVTLDRDHGWRIWVIVTDWELALNDPAGVPLYMDPDDLEHVREPHKIPLSELKKMVDFAWGGGDGTVNLETLINRGQFLVQRTDRPHELGFREDLT